MPLRRPGRVALTMPWVVAAGMTACSSFTGSGGDTTSDGGSDAAVSDAADQADGRDAFGPETGTNGNLLINPDFETGCGGWSWPGGDPAQPTFASDDQVFHGGQRACRVCSTGGGTFTIAQVVKHPTLAGADVAGGVYLHSSTDAGAGLQSVVVSLVTIAASGMPAEHADTPGPKVDGNWSLASVELATTTDALQLELYVRATADAAGFCFVVDDAFLTVKGP